VTEDFIKRIHLKVYSFLLKSAIVFIIVFFSGPLIFLTILSGVLGFSCRRVFML